MGRQVISIVLCLLAWKDTLGATAVLKTIVQDNVGAESAPRLYRNVPVYASSAPYGAFSIQIPTFITSPKASASRIVPVQEYFQNTGQLRDSYGNRFVGAPQSFGYKAAFPQQFVQLQELPAHLSQPLVAAAPNHQFKQPTPFAVNSHYTLPLQVAAASSHQRFGPPQQVAYGDTIKNFRPSSSFNSQIYGQPVSKQQSTGNNAVYVNSLPQEQYHGLNNGQQFQSLQQIPQDVEIINVDNGPSQHSIQQENAQLQAPVAKESAISTVVNGKKTVVHVETEPVPLLDLSLLEPLTFENPLVPQVQHFLPRISQATYHALPKPKVNGLKASYEGGTRRRKSKSGSKKKQKRPSHVSKTHEKNTPVNPTVIKDVANENPEISYEIDTPNYKESYKEKAISYNKETQSEPVTYSYGSKTENEPVHYSYAHNTKEPLKVKDVNYEQIGQGPKQLIYNFDSDEQPKEQNGKHESENSKESEESEDESPIENIEQIEEPPKSQHHKSEHIEDERDYHRPSNYRHREIQNSPNHYYTEPRHASVKNVEQFSPITHYEENIKLVPEEKFAQIKVDPNQHVQNGPSDHKPVSNPVPALEPKQQSHESDENQHNHSHHSSHSSRPHSEPQHIQEKSRQEEEPEETHSLREKIMAQMIKDNENNEEDFEKDYKNAAYGFPAYSQAARDSEKEIYNPQSYGALRDQNDYDVEHVPFQQYQDEGDQFPKTTRLSYKDARDRTKEDYYLDFALSRPESLTDRYRNKIDYYKLFKEQKPQRYVASENEKNKENEKYSSKYVFKPVQHQKNKQTLGQYKAAPKPYEYDYSKEAPRDSSAYASRPSMHYKSKTLFVEPQFQFGFEPISIPRLLVDSELAAMASNHSPESEKPAMRKKVYKENWYIKKTQSGGRDNS